MQKTFKGLLIAFSLSSICVIAACTAHPAKTLNPVISISPLDKDHVKVEYKLVTDAIELSDFYGERTAQLRGNWKGLNNCGELLEGKILTQYKGCNSVSFAVPIEAKFIDRVNPVAYPMGDKGVLVHTATFAIKADNVTWSFISPKNTILVNGTATNSNISIDQTQQNSIYYTGVFFSYDKLPADISVIATQTVPEKLFTGISESSKQISHYYQASYPLLSFLQPTLFINNITKVDNDGAQFDVLSPQMIRFGFVNWQESHLADTRAIVAHEFAHMLQPKVENQPFITEGGAEFIRWISEYRMGWRTAHDLANNFSYMLQFCLDSTDKQSWQDIQNQQAQDGYIPYACGLSIHIVALASRANSENAEKTLENYYLELKKNPNTDFAQAIECGFIKDCKPHFLPRLLNGKESLSEVFETQLQQLSLIKGKGYGEAASQSQLGAKAFANLMLEDCAGTDFTSMQDHYKTGTMLSCKSLPSDIKISSVEGISYFTDPLKAIAAQNKGCTSHQQVTLTTVNKQSINVSCTKSFTPQPHHYDIDIEKLLTLLDKPQ